MGEYLKIELELLEAAANECRMWTGKDNKFPTENLPQEICNVYYAGADIGYTTGHDHGVRDGKQAERDAFWDIYQQNGNRTSYSYSFSGHGWTKDIFKPKYDIRPVGNAAASMFHVSNIDGDLVEILEQLGIEMDFSACTQFGSTFGSTNFTRIGVVDTRKAVGLSSTFSGSDELVTIVLLKLKDDGSQTFTNTFNNCTALENITIEGTIGDDIDLHWSTKLSRESIDSFIYHLSTTVSGKTLTLSKTAVDNAYAVHDEEYDYTVPGSQTNWWASMVNVAPNWTIALTD